VDGLQPEYVLSLACDDPASACLFVTRDHLCNSEASRSADGRPAASMVP
jgi:hypothetical protein